MSIDNKMRFYFVSTVCFLLSISECVCDVSEESIVMCDALLHIFVSFDLYSHI